MKKLLSRTTSAVVAAVCICIFSVFLISGISYAEDPSSFMSIYQKTLRKAYLDSNYQVQYKSLLGYKEIHNLADSVVKCGEGKMEDCWNLESSTHNFHIEVRDPGWTTFRLFVPPGTIGVAASLLVLQGSDTGAVVRYEQPPAVYDTSVGFSSPTWKWEDDSGASLEELKVKDYLARIFTAHITIVNNGFSTPLQQGNWIYVRMLYGPENVGVIKYALTVDIATFQRWYDTVAWESNGDPPITATAPSNSKPILSSATAPFEVSEDYPAGTVTKGNVVGTILASDADVGDVLSFRFKDPVNQYLSTYFEIVRDTNSNNAVIKVKADGLDYDDPNLPNPLTFNVIANDRKIDSDPKEYQIKVLDVDEPTVVTPQGTVVIEVDEHSSSARTAVDPLYQISATDPDKDTVLKYYLYDSNTKARSIEYDYFIINESDGRIRLSTKCDDGSLHAEIYNESNPLKFTVQVVDDKHKTASEPVEFTVKVKDLNDPPLITADQSFTVSEDAEATFNFGTVEATDPDQQNVSNEISNVISSYEITRGDADGCFAIDTDGKISVSKAGCLNFEQTKSYSLTVKVSDGIGGATGSSEGTVTINVTDANDPPVITSGQTFYIPENASPGSAVGKVLSTDEDSLNETSAFPKAAVSYQIVSGGDGDGNFVIDNSGNITASSTADLDYEAIPEYTLTIKVSDGISDSTGTVTIKIGDVNDGEANLSPERFVNAGASIDDPVGTLSGLLDLDDVIGILQILAGISSPPSFYQIIDLGSNQKIEMTEALYILQVIAGVRTNSLLTYTIVSGNEEGFFKIDQATGEIMIAQEGITVPANDCTCYTLTVEVAVEGGSTFTDDITITVLP